MSSSRIPSPARSQGGMLTPRRYRPVRRTRSVGSPSVTPARLSSVVEQFKENNMESFALSPMDSRVSILTDTTEIEQPRRKSWWKKLDDNSRDMQEVMEANQLDADNVVMEYIDVEILSQEQKNYTIDLPESSGSESIDSIVIPQRKLFTQKNVQPQKKFGKVVGSRESIAKASKANVEENRDVEVGTKNLFNRGTNPKPKPTFPAALLTLTPNKTLNKTKELNVPEVKGQVRSLFGNRVGSKRKNMFADFIVSESEDEIPDIQPKVFGFHKKPEASRPPSIVSRTTREHSPTSSVTTDLEMDDWKLLPSSTMVENQLEHMIAGENTPSKRARLSQLTEIKESDDNINASVANLTKANKSVVKNKSTSSSKSKNKSQLSPGPETNQVESLKPQDIIQNDSQREITICEQVNKSNTESINKSVDENVNESRNILSNTSKSISNSIKAVQTDVEHKNTTIIQEKSLSHDEIDDLSVVQDDEEFISLQYDDLESVDKDSEISIEGNLTKQKTNGTTTIMNTSKNNSKKHNATVIEECDQTNINKDELLNKEEVENVEVTDTSNHVQDNKYDDSLSKETVVDYEEYNDEKELEPLQEDEKVLEDSPEEMYDNNDNSDNFSEKIQEKIIEENQDDVSEQNEKDDTEEDQKNITEQFEEQISDDMVNEENEDDLINSSNQEEQEIEESEAADASDQSEDEEEIQEAEANSMKEQEVNETDKSNSDDDSDNHNEDKSNCVDISNESAVLNVSNEEITQENQDKSDEQNIVEMESDKEESEDAQNSEPKEPEEVLHEVSNRNETYFPHARSSSIRKTKSMFKPSETELRQSLTPVRESTGFSDGGRDSSAEGSGWDSHRTTRKTLRQTFGNGFTPRKSLRALVMEKSAKRQTVINEANAELNIPQANSSETPEFPENSIPADDVPMDYDDDVTEVMETSNHDISKRTRQTTLEMYLQKIKKANLEKRIQIQEAVKASLAAPSKDVNIFKVPFKPALRRATTKTVQSKPKEKTSKTTFFTNSLPKEVLEDMKYKPPKRFQPSNAPWITKRLYSYLETKLEPKYDYKARVRAERLVEKIYDFTKVAKRHEVAPVEAINELKAEMAALEIVQTHFEFYEFFHDFLPRAIRVKVNPDVVNNIPGPRNGIFSNILPETTARG